MRAVPFAALKIRVFILTGYKQSRGRFVAMPTLAVQSAATPKSGAEELCKKLSSTVAGTLGKPESYVMVTFQKVDAMSYAVRKSDMSQVTTPSSCRSYRTSRRGVAEI